MHSLSELHLSRRSLRATEENTPCEEINAIAAELGFKAPSSLSPTAPDIRLLISSRSANKFLNEV